MLKPSGSPLFGLWSKDAGWKTMRGVTLTFEDREKAEAARDAFKMTGAQVVELRAVDPDANVLASTDPNQLTFDGASQS